MRTNSNTAEIQDGEKFTFAFLVFNGTVKVSASLSIVTGGAVLFFDAVDSNGLPVLLEINADSLRSNGSIVTILPSSED